MKSGCSPRQKELGIVPADGPQAVAPRSRRADWESLPPEARAVQPVHGGVRRLPSHTDHQVGRLVEFLRVLGELDNTLIMVISAQRRRAPGRAHPQELSSNAQEPLEESLERIDEIGGPEDLQPLPVGLDVGREPSAGGSGAAPGGRRQRSVRSRLLLASRVRPRVRTHAHIIGHAPGPLPIEPPKTSISVTWGMCRALSAPRTMLRGSTPPHAALRDRGCRHCTTTRWLAWVPAGWSRSPGGMGLVDLPGWNHPSRTWSGWEAHHVAVSPRPRGL